MDLASSFYRHYILARFSVLAVFGQWLYNWIVCRTVSEIFVQCFRYIVRVNLVTSSFDVRLTNNMANKERKKCH